MPSSGVFYNQFSNILEESVWITKKIARLVSQGVPPQEIAIIARKHSHLQEMVPILHKLEIPINYERDENVLEKSYIKQIIDILRFINSLNKVESLEAQELLPEILCYPFWRIPNLIIYQISIESAKKRQNWLVTMSESEDKDITQLADFFRELAKLSVSCTAEQILDEILGVAKELKLPDQENEENDETVLKNYNYDPSKGKINKIELDEIESQKCLTRYISPFKWYYFDSNYTTSNTEYFTFLSNLKAFFTAIREYKKRQPLSVDDVLEFVELMSANDLPLNDNSVYNQQKDTVCLLTAHKAKGLEFEYVFVINCLEKDWNGRKPVNKIGSPVNLALLPESESADDSIRLLFVALTRAKKYLCLTAYEKDSNSKLLEKLSFLEDLELPQDTDCTDQLSHNSEELQVWLKSKVQNRDLTLEEKSYLKPILENYKLSVTHLNNFLDLSQGGPRLFLEHNLLKFPQSKLVSGSYGTAMHAALARFYKEFTETNFLPDILFLQRQFEDALRNERLNKDDFKDCLGKGQHHLDAYYKQKKDSFSTQDKIEFDFASQSIVLGGAKITGKIDKMCFNQDQTILVVDLKTGKSFDTWKASSLHDQIKLDRYHRQLVFYKILVENSREYGAKYKVWEGSLEFLEENKSDEQIKSLATMISVEEALDLAKLIQVVYRRIQNFEFELAKYYSPDLEGTKNFIQDLITEY